VLCCLNAPDLLLSLFSPLAREKREPRKNITLPDTTTTENVRYFATPRHLTAPGGKRSDDGERIKDQSAIITA